MLGLVVLCCVLSVLVVVCEGRFGGVLKEQEEHISQEMASKFGALAGAAVAAVGALCSYEARVLHLHSSPGESFQVPFALFSLGLPSPVSQPVEREGWRWVTPHGGVQSCSMGRKHGWAGNLRSMWI